MPPEKKNDSTKFSRSARMMALAFAAVGELLAGPFAGYFIATFGVQHFGWNNAAVSVGVFAGFIVGVYLVIRTIEHINRITDAGQ